MCQKLNSENRDKLPISERPADGEGAGGPHADWNLGAAPTGKIYEAPIPDGTAPPVRPPSHSTSQWQNSCTQLNR
jgi:hypothetical protein